MARSRRTSKINLGRVKSGGRNRPRPLPVQPPGNTQNRTQPECWSSQEFGPEWEFPGYGMCMGQLPHGGGTIIDNSSTAEMIAWGLESYLQQDGVWPTYHNGCHFFLCNVVTDCPGNQGMDIVPLSTCLNNDGGPGGLRVLCENPDMNLYHVNTDSNYCPDDVWMQNGWCATGLLGYSSVQLWQDYCLMANGNIIGDEPHECGYFMNRESCELNYDGDGGCQWCEGFDMCMSYMEWQNACPDFCLYQGGSNPDQCESMEQCRWCWATMDCVSSYWDSWNDETECGSQHCGQILYSEYCNFSNTLDDFVDGPCEWCWYSGECLGENNWDMQCPDSNHFCQYQNNPADCTTNPDCEWCDQIHECMNFWDWEIQCPQDCHFYHDEWECQSGWGWDGPCQWCEQNHMCMDQEQYYDDCPSGHCNLPGQIEDCFGQCCFEDWIGDGYCDDGTMSECNFNCSQFDYDGGDCIW